MSRFPFWTGLGAALLLLPAGCAKGPPGSPTGGGSNITGRQLIISMTVRGNIDLANDYYYAVFNVNGATRNGFTGPVPVVTDFERGGNGFAGGAFCLYVECHQGAGTTTGTPLGIYGVDSTLLTPTYIGPPVQESVNGGTFQVQIPLADIATAYANQTGTSFTESDITNLEVNFIATNVVPVNPQSTSVKYFDALGDPRLGQTNAFVTIPTTQDTTYTNDTLGGQEPTEDVATYSPGTNTSQTDYSSSVQVVPDQSPANIANLDIADAGGPAWSIEIRG